MTNSSKYSNVLISGGAGFIGSQYIRSNFHGKFLSFEHRKISIVDALTYAGNLDRIKNELGNPDLSFDKFDISNLEIVENYSGKFDAIIHFAAESHVDRSIENPDAFLKTNIIGTKNMLEIARISKVPIVIVSTDEVYGSIAKGTADEEYPLNPSSAYSASKASADLIALAYFKTHHVDVRVTRCVNNYGKFQDPEKLIPKSIISLQKSGSANLYGNGENIRDWIHVEDHCNAINLVLELGKSGEIYNIGNDKEIKNLDLIHFLSSGLGILNPKINFTPDRLGHDYRYSVDSSKIRTTLNWAPKRNLYEDFSELLFIL
jgi:dTDP-glucose 4,6-dehydratase